MIGYLAVSDSGTSNCCRWSKERVKSFHLQVYFQNVRMAYGFAQNCEILSLDKKRLESVKGSYDSYYSRLIFSKYVSPLRLINETDILF